MNRFLSRNKSRFAIGVLTGVLLYGASTITGSPPFDLNPGFGFGSTVSTAPAGASILSFELA